MSPAWIGPAIDILGAVALFVMAPRAKATEQPPAGRQWAIERCHGDDCRLLETRYSGPTACALDAASERLGKQQKDGTRLVCVRAKPN